MHIWSEKGTVEVEVSMKKNGRVVEGVDEEHAHSWAKVEEKAAFKWPKLWSYLI